MNFDRAETIAKAMLWLGGVLLFAWSWQVSGSFVAALIIVAVGGFFVLLLAGPAVALVALLIDALITMAGRITRSSRP